MEGKISFKTCALFFLLAAVLNAGLSFGQEEVTPSGEGEGSRENAAIAQMQWLWGEVVSLDPGTNQMLVRFVNYETSSEQEIIMNVDTQTVYEGVKSIYDIKASDAVTIDYIVTTEGENIARNVSVETRQESPDKTE